MKKKKNQSYLISRSRLAFNQSQLTLIYVKENNFGTDTSEGEMRLV